MENLVISNYGNSSSKNYGVHTLRISDENRTLWFSYSTLVAFRDKQGNKYVRKNEWGPTTGKHLNLIDGGFKENRIDGKTFEKIFKEKFNEDLPTINI